MPNPMCYGRMSEESNSLIPFARSMIKKIPKVRLVRTFGFGRCEPFPRQRDRIVRSSGMAMTNHQARRAFSSFVRKQLCLDAFYFSCFCRLLWRPTLLVMAPSNHVASSFARRSLPFRLPRLCPSSAHLRHLLQYTLILIDMATKS